MIDRSIFAQSVDEVARALLGATLTHRLASGTISLRICEVEAYGGVGEDPGSHAFRGQTRRNQTMFAAGGHLYVYRSYGMHWCANVVAGPAGEASGILLRAGQVTAGADLAWQLRQDTGVCRRERDLARGPGRLTAAVGISGEHDGVDLFGDSRFELAVAPDRTGPVGVSTRTGVSGVGGLTMWRFFLPDDPYVSVHRPAPTRVVP